ncbi:MAG: hypothetical protein ACYTGZ_05010 [Planctomycetota bacterium]
MVQLTFRECSRRGFPYLVAAGLILMVLASRLFLAFTFGHGREESLNLAISGVFLAGFLVSAFQGTALLRQDFDRGTFALLLTKPTRPATYLLGRLIGLFAASCLACGIVAAGAAACLVLLPLPNAPTLTLAEVVAASSRALPPILLLNAAALAISSCASRTAAPVVLLVLFLAGSLAGGTPAGVVLPDFGLFSLDANATAPGSLALLYAFVFSSFFLVAAYIVLALRSPLPGQG